MPVTLDLTAANILDKAKKYSMYPIDAAEGYVPGNETNLAGYFAGFRHTLISNIQKITRLSVVKPDPGRNRGADFVVKPSLTAVAGAHSYFLPWDGRGAAVQMTIPRFMWATQSTPTGHILYGCSERVQHHLQRHPR